MTDLRTAAQALVDRWDTPLWKDAPHTGKYIDALRAALSAPPGWQPIETAPKDELILVGPTKRMGICVAMNHSRDGWVTETCSEWATIYVPTHWMPLPDPPAAPSPQEPT